LPGGDGCFANSSIRQERRPAPSSHHTSPGSMLTFGSDTLSRRCLSDRSRGCGRRVCGSCLISGSARPGGRWCAGRLSWCGAGRQAGRGAADVFGLPDIPGCDDALVAGGEQAGDPQGERGQSGQAAPAAGDAGGGGVFDGGERPLGGGAPLVGLPPGGRRVVVLLPGFGRDRGGDGDGLLGAAGRRVLGRGEDQPDGKPMQNAVDGSRLTCGQPADQRPSPQVIAKCEDLTNQAKGYQHQDQIAG
jgi:hypothetical protein